MAEMTTLGWFHTIIAIIGILFGIYALWVHKIIRLETISGKIYLLCTFIAAATALMIYNQGPFGPAHALGVLTLLALLGGYLVKKIPFFDPIADYFQAFCWTGTFLFHMIPAITDGLLRLPIGDPFLDRFDHPVLIGFHLTFVALFFVGYVMQFRWLRKQKLAAA